MSCRRRKGWWCLEVGDPKINQHHPRLFMLDVDTELYTYIYISTISPSPSVTKRLLYLGGLGIYEKDV
jgi:hypothetical protein